MDTKKLRQKILDLAIRGKLVPQAPNDEPASVLLERIRAEKERLIKEGKIKRSKKVAADDEIEAPFEIPECWEWVKIGELCDVVRGGSPRPAGSKEFYDGPIPFLKVADLTQDEGKYVYVAQNSIKEAGLSRTRMIEADTLLLTNSGATLGVPKINTFPTTINDGIAAFLFLPNDIKLYVYWFLKSKTNSFRCIDQGAAQPNLNTDLIKAEQIPLPPLAEQKRIANEVERWFTLIDELESNEGDLLKAIDKAKSKILDLAIHGKLVPQDPNDEPAIDLLKRINPDFEACDEEDCPYTIPQNWEWTSLGILYNIVSAKRVLKSDWKHKGIPFYRAREIVKLASEGQVDNELFISKSHYEEMKTIYSVPNPSDIMMSAVGTIGKTYIVKENDVFYYKDASVLCLQNNNNMYSEFISIVLSSQFLQDQMFEQSKGTTVDTITIEKAKSYILPLPPIQEQLRIVAKIEELFSVLDSIKESLE